MVQNQQHCDYAATYNRTEQNGAACSADHFSHWQQLVSTVCQYMADNMTQQRGLQCRLTLLVDSVGSTMRVPVTGHGGGVEAVVNQPLGNVLGLNACIRQT